MKNFFYKLNKKYINSFLDDIFDIYNSNDKKTHISFLQSILKGVNILFSNIGARVTSKADIPLPDDYPESKKFNKLVKNVSFDIEKLYKAQSLIEDDVNNLMKFNSNQRRRTAVNLSEVQYDVYNAYIKSKKDIKGGV